MIIYLKLTWTDADDGIGFDEMKSDLPDFKTDSGGGAMVKVEHLGKFGGVDFKKEEGEEGEESQKESCEFGFELEGEGEKGDEEGDCESQKCSKRMGEKKGGEENGNEEKVEEFLGREEIGG